MAAQLALVTIAALVAIGLVMIYVMRYGG